MPMTPNEPKQAAFKVVCDSHGVVEEQIEDWIAASLVAEEHREDCPAKCSWVRSDEGQFTSAADMIQERSRERHHSGERDPENCPRCMAWIGGDEGECHRCGHDLEDGPEEVAA